MRSIVKTIVLLVVLIALSAGSARAAGELVIRLATPQSPTQETALNVPFVVLDQAGNRDVTVTCTMQYESGSTQTVGTYTLTAGGNTGTCQLTNLNQTGTYTVGVHAGAGSDTADDAAQVTVNNVSPDAVRDYFKNKIDNCHYLIHFKTADDGGRTTAVEIYRSTLKTFSTDSNSRIAAIAIGSNTVKDYTDMVNDCNQENYYAIRAFAANGNGSDVTGDHTTVTTTTTTETVYVTPRQSAIPVKTGAVLGARSPKTATESGTPVATAAGTVLGENQDAMAAPLWQVWLTKIPWLVWLVIGLFGVTVFLVYRPKLFPKR